MLVAVHGVSEEIILHICVLIRIEESDETVRFLLKVIQDSEVHLHHLFLYAVDSDVGKGIPLFGIIDIRQLLVDEGLQCSFVLILISHCR